MMGSSYLLINEIEIAKNATLKPRNWVKALCRLEKSRSKADFQKVVNELFLWFNDPGFAEVKQAFSQYIKYKYNNIPNLKNC
jgi:hypothetical protein